MVSNEEVEKIAKLAKFKLSSEEIVTYGKQLREIMEMIDPLKEFACKDITPLTSVCDSDQRMRKDQVIGEDISEELFNHLLPDKKALAKQVRCYITPKVVE